VFATLSGCRVGLAVGGSGVAAAQACAASIAIEARSAVFTSVLQLVDDRGSAYPVVRVVGS
jgi:hypothetical protein